jgi:hypothetical protein
MLIFPNNRTEKFKGAIAALVELEQSEAGMGRYACGEFLSHENEKILKNRGIKKLNSYPCIRRVLKKRHLSGGRSAWMSGAACKCHLPGSDHTDLWKTPDGNIIYVTQPYGIDWENLRALVKMGVEMGLEISIGAESTWFPGRTIIIKARNGENNGKA